jgi:DNA end-binding protein Ku
MLKAEDMVILLNQMRFASEIRPMDGLSLPKKQEVSPREIRMAVKLVDLLSGPWAPEKFHDTYIEDLKALIQQKIEGKAIEEKEEAISFEVSNLFARLNESLELARQGDGRGSG